MVVEMWWYTWYNFNNIMAIVTLAAQQNQYMLLGSETLERGLNIRYELALVLEYRLPTFA